MFGDNVPSTVSRAAMETLAPADGILVAGTSLQVFSAYKFVLYAREHNIPIAIVNIGSTRGDADAALKIETRLGDILPRILLEEHLYKLEYQSL